MVSKNYKRTNYARRSESSRKRLLLVLFLLLVGWYLGPKIKNQISSVQLKNQYFKVYREFSQAVGLFQYKDGEFTPTAYADSKRFVKNFSSLFAVDNLCETPSNLCLTNNKTVYTTLDGKIYPSFLQNPNIGQFVLLDETLVMLNNIKGNLWITVDINGIKHKPNKLGLDLFTFLVGSDEMTLKIMGSSGTPYMNMSKYCNPYKSNKHNGLPCSYKAVIEKTYFEDIKHLLH